MRAAVLAGPGRVGFLGRERLAEALDRACER